jgi:hypothetical protein
MQAFYQAHLHTNWEQIKPAVIEEFGPDEFEAQMHMLLHLRQTSRVAEYSLQLVYM